MLGELVPVGGGDPIPMLRSQLLVGRRDSCDISLQFPNVSSQHCELELIDGYWLAKDLGSSNGTKINGVRIKKSWVLPGDEITFAKHRFKIDYNVIPGTTPPVLMDSGEDIQVGLLEKAGLARPERPRRSSVSSKAPTPPNGIVSPRKPPPRNDDDRAFEWLNNDE